MIKVLIFDFDGVIVDSNYLKIQSYFDIFPKDKQTQNVIKDILDKYEGKPRFFLIRQIKEKRGLPASTEFYIQKYNEIADDRVIKCPMINGAKEVLKKLSQRYLLYLSSGTPLDNLKNIVERRHLITFFKDIYGAPKSKMEHICEIIKKENVEGTEILVIGDRQLDLDAAKKFNCKFIGIKNSFNDFNDNSFPILDNLKELPARIDKLSKKNEQ